MATVVIADTVDADGCAAGLGGQAAAIGGADIAGACVIATGDREPGDVAKSLLAQKRHLRLMLKVPYVSAHLERLFSWSKHSVKECFKFRFSNNLFARLVKA